MEQVESRTRSRFAACCLLMIFFLIGCDAGGSVIDFSALQRAMQVTQSPKLSQAGAVQHEVLRVGEDVYYELQRIEPDPDLILVGMLDAQRAYALDPAAPETLWLCRLDTKQRQDLATCREAGAQIASEIVFNEVWLIWQEIGAFQLQDDGALLRSCHLYAKDLTRPETEALLLDSGGTTAMQAYFLPFDSLDLDHNTLVYRRSTFQQGLRDTEVRLIDLLQPEIVTLAQSREENDRIILSCSIDQQLVAWDMQISYRVGIAGISSIGARYNLYTYQLDNSKLLSTEEPLSQIAMNRSYHMPCVYRDAIFVSERLSMTLNDWGTRSAIVQINPVLLSVSQIAQEFSYAEELLQYYQQRYEGALRNISRAIERTAPQVGKKLLTWSSNVAEDHLVFDLELHRLVELPVYFSDAAEESSVTYTKRIDGKETEVIAAVRPNLENIRVQPLPGLDADYLLFEHIYDLEPPYILRVK